MIITKYSPHSILVQQHEKEYFIPINIFGKFLNKFGSVDTGNYTEFTENGTLILHGESTVFRDELNALIGQKLETPASDIIVNIVEGSLTFKSSCTTADYVTMNVQLNHDWKMGSNIFPHIHWWQISSNIPRWLIGYRWQRNGELKNTDWLYKKWASHAFTYTTGTLNQISSFGPITPPTGYGISDVIQFRLIRDTTNLSTLFTGPSDPQSGSIDAVSFDVHIECDGLGSNHEYRK